MSRPLDRAVLAGEWQLDWCGCACRGIFACRFAGNGRLLEYHKMIGADTVVH